MKSGYDRRLHRFLSSSAIIAQTAGIACLAPFIGGGRYFERVASFVALSMLAWWLNAVARAIAEHHSRQPARRRTERLHEVAFALFGSAFGITAFVYLILLPTWPIFSGALLFGGCAGYILTNA